MCYIILLLVPLLLPCSLRAQQSPAEEGADVAAAMRAHRASTDTLLLDSITAPAIDLRDGQIFEAAMDIAGDPSASVEARVFALRTLIEVRYPGMLLSYGDLTGTPEQPGTCLGPGPHTHFVLRKGEPVPADYDARITDLTTRLIQDESVPFPVRHAARCASGYTPSPFLDQPPEEYDVIVTGERVELDYVCENQFRVRNPYDLPMKATYEVEGTSETGMLSLPPAAEGEEFSETFFTTTNMGPVRLIQEEQVTATAANGNTPCS